MIQLKHLRHLEDALYESLQLHYQGFLLSSEYETMLMEIHSHSPLDIISYRVPSHVSIHRAPSKQCFSDPGIKVVGIWRVINGKVEFSSKPPLSNDGISDSLPHFLCLGEKFTCSLHNFAFSVRGLSTSVYGCSLECSVNHLPSQSLVKSPTPTFKDKMLFGKSWRRTFMRRLRRSRDGHDFDETWNENKPASDTNSTFTPRSESNSATRGAFILSTFPIVDKAREYLLKNRCILETGEIEWDALSDHIIEPLELECHTNRIGSLSGGCFRDIDPTVVLTVSSNTFVNAMTEVLLEHKLILVSSHVTRLVAFFESLLLCFSPLHWCHLYFPYLPLTYGDILQSPVPYLIGIRKKDYLELKEKSAIAEDVLSIDIDSDTILSTDNGEKPLPTAASLLKFLRANIVHSSKYYDDFSSGAHADSSTASTLVSSCQNFVKQYVGIIRLFHLKINADAQLLKDLISGNTVKDVPQSVHRRALDDASLALIDEKLCRIYFMHYANRKHTIEYDVSFVREILRTQSLSNYILNCN